MVELVRSPRKHQFSVLQAQHQALVLQIWIRKERGQYKNQNEPVMIFTFKPSALKILLKCRICVCCISPKIPPPKYPDFRITHHWFPVTCTSRTSRQKKQPPPHAWFSLVMTTGWDLQHLHWLHHWAWVRMTSCRSFLGTRQVDRQKH